MRRAARLACGVLCQTATALAAANDTMAPQAFYAVEWSLVSAGQSTAYVKWGSTDAATCSCDLHDKQCDVTAAGGCRCDSDCTSTEKAAFKADLPEGTVERVSNVCDSELVATNLALLGRERNSKYALSSKFLNDQLCIVVENSPQIGTYFTDPGSIKETVKGGKPASTLTGNKLVVAMETSDAKARSEFSSFSFARTDSISPTFGNAYVYGVPVLLTGSKPTRYFHLPVRDWSGACSVYNPATFGIDAGPSICTRRASGALSNATCQAFSAAAHLYSGADTLAATPVRTQAVQSTFYMRGHRTNPGGLPHDYADASRKVVPGTYYDPASKSCRNVLDAVAYTVEHNTEGQIKHLNVEMWFKDTQDTNIEQNFTLAYTTRNMKLLEGQPKPRTQRSGAPGYAVGLPVLAGVQESYFISGPTQVEKKAIREREQGLHVLGPSIGAKCLGLSAPVSFKTDSVITCTLELTEAQLEAACKAQEPGQLNKPAETLFTQFLNGSDTHLGVLGNARYNTLSDWMPLLPKEAIPAGSYQTDSNTCQKLVTQYHLEIYVAPVGNQLSAQDKIVGAFYSYGTSHVQHEVAEWAGQELELRTTVSFIEMPDKGLVEKVKAIPKLPALPDDLFYPFSLPSPLS